MKSVFGGRIIFAVALVALIFGATFMMAQGIVTGTISGVVQDPQGAVVPNATVTVTQVSHEPRIHNADALRQESLSCAICLPEHTT